jgi:dsDNA-binding SOS-regulon protein
VSYDDDANELSVIAVDIFIDVIRRTDIASCPKTRTELELFLADTRERMSREFRAKLDAIDKEEIDWDDDEGHA